MYETLETGPASSRQKPSLLNLLTEIPRTLAEIGSLAMTMPCLAAGSPKGDGHSVMVVPGFLTGDESTAALRRFLTFLGYRAQGWQLGRNTGQAALMATHLPDRFLALVKQAEAPVTLIGHSLGGVFSRELARLYPDQVRQVIALGSPITIGKEAAVADVVQRLFEQSTGYTPEEMRDALEFFESDDPPEVPMTAIYSKGDGVVHWEGCIEVKEGAQTQNIEVCGSHCGMAFNPSIYRIIADRLAQPVGSWQKFE